MRFLIGSFTLRVPFDFYTPATVPWNFGSKNENGETVRRYCHTHMASHYRGSHTGTQYSTETCSAGTLRPDDDWKLLPRSKAAAETALGPWASESQSASSMQGFHPSAEGTTVCVSSSSSRRGHRFSCRPSSALPAVSPPSRRSLPSRPARSWSEHEGSPPGAQP